MDVSQEKPDGFKFLLLNICILRKFMSIPKLSNNWINLIKPSKLSIETVDNDAMTTKFTIMPLERGYGVTLGNALRRVLLSSIQGAAIVAFKISGVFHEFGSIIGVKEDVLNIVLNLKAIVIKSTSEGRTLLRVNKKGPCVVTAAMIESNQSIEILNPDQIICTLAAGANLDMELFCDSGNGYMSASSNEDVFPAGAIKIDALFSPVQQVSYSVEHTRIGQITDYDKLIMIIKTNGSIAPEMAIKIGAHIIKDQLQIFGVLDNLVEDKVAQVSDLSFNPVLLRKVDELELSVRSHNCLKCDNIVYIGDLVRKTEAEMLKTPNFGRKSLNELKEILLEMKVEFGMKVPDWPPHNIEELIKKYEDNQYKFK